MTITSFKKYLAEAIGTMVLVLFGCGTAVMVGCGDAAGLLTTALAFGLSIVAMAYCIGNISGCHINPAVSLAVYLTGGIELKELLFYVMAQIVGAFAGSGLLALITHQTGSLGQNMLQTGVQVADKAVDISIGSALVIEVVLTFVFVLVILGVTSKPANSSVSGIVIGLSLTFVHILGIRFTGTSVNPARSLAPAILAGGDALSQVWIFILAPLAGAAIAAAVWRFISSRKVSGRR